MPTDDAGPTIPPEALEAAALDVYERTACSPQMAERIARGAITAALPLLLPGMYVTREPGGDATIWTEGTPAHPGRPEPMLMRTVMTAHLFDAVAALLPDRTEEG